VSAPAYLYRRSITDPGGNVVYVVYAVGSIPGEKPEPIPALAAFPAGWRATDFPGQCLAVVGAQSEIFEKCAPRSQFRHYERMTKADALGLYPDLLR
jgi:hypothetical protein